MIESYSLRRDGTILVGNLPNQIQESIRKIISKYTTGLIGVSDSLQSDKIHLIGSGTFVRFNQLFGILTAGHVLKKGLRDKTKNIVGLGLTLTIDADRFVIPINEIDYIVKYGQGQSGPDFGVIFIPQSFVAKIEESRDFWNINENRDFALNSMQGYANYLAALSGIPEENTKEVAPEGGFLRTISFGGMVGFTGIDREWKARKFDFIETSALYNEDSESPRSFKGMSGGGLWKTTIEKLRDGSLSHRAPFLAGLILRETEKIQGLRQIICHGSKTIYELLYSELEKFENAGAPHV